MIKERSDRGAPLRTVASVIVFFAPFLLFLRIVGGHADRGDHLLRALIAAAMFSLLQRVATAAGAAEASGWLTLSLDPPSILIGR